jgi:phage anti-repressor protein
MQLIDKWEYEHGEDYLVVGSEFALSVGMSQEICLMHGSAIALDARKFYAEYKSQARAARTTETSKLIQAIANGEIIVTEDMNYCAAPGDFSVIQPDENKMISGRALFAFLDLEAAFTQNFKEWILGLISEFGLKYGRDFEEKGADDYLLNLDVAKLVCAVHESPAAEAALQFYDKLDEEAIPLGGDVVDPRVRVVMKGEWTIRYREDAGEPLFLLVPVAQTLGFEDPYAAIHQFCDPSGLTRLNTLTATGEQSLLYGNEQCLMELFESATPLNIETVSEEEMKKLLLAQGVVTPEEQMEFYRFLATKGVTMRHTSKGLVFEGLSLKSKLH